MKVFTDFLMHKLNQKTTGCKDFLGRGQKPFPQYLCKFEVCKERGFFSKENKSSFQSHKVGVLFFESLP